MGRISKNVKFLISIFLIITLMISSQSNNIHAQETTAKDMFATSRCGLGYCENTKDYIQLDMSLEGEIQPSGFEIYRAKKKKGTYQRIKIVKEITKNVYYHGYQHEEKIYWKASYKDERVKLFDIYYYKVRAFVKVGNKKIYSLFSFVEKGVCSNNIGKYKCKIIKTTKNKLILKLTSDKKNGKMEIGDDGRRYALLVGKKGSDGEQTERKMLCEKISRDGKKWHPFNKKRIKIMNNQSVYLWYEYYDGYEYHDGGNNIDIEEYTHAQIMHYAVKYNLSRYGDSPQLRINLIKKKAEIDYFHVWDSEASGRVTHWDDNEFVTDVDEE